MKLLNSVLVELALGSGQAASIHKEAARTGCSYCHLIFMEVNMVDIKKDMRGTV